MRGSALRYLCRPAGFMLLVSLAAALPCAAILIRPDRDDAEYLELALRYVSSLALGPSGGEGVLIAPRWVLTAARGLMVAGILRATDSEWETYARVSAYAAWIDAVMIDMARKEADDLLDPQRR